MTKPSTPASFLIRGIVLPTLACSFFLSGCGSSETADATPAPKFTVQTLDTPVKLLNSSEMLKGKVTVVDFWATWCVPCRTTMPIIYGVYHTYKAKGLDVVAITDEPRSKVTKFRDDTKLDYPMYIDNAHDALLAFGVKMLPTMYVVNKKGNIVYTHSGGDIDQMELKKVIDDALR